MQTFLMKSLLWTIRLHGRNEMRICWMSNALDKQSARWVIPVRWTIPCMRNPPDEQCAWWAMQQMRIAYLECLIYCKAHNIPYQLGLARQRHQAVSGFHSEVQNLNFCTSESEPLNLKTSTANFQVYQVHCTCLWNKSARPKAFHEKTCRSFKNLR